MLLEMSLGFPGGSDIKETACNVGDLGLIPVSRRSLEKEMATHSSILAWRIPWIEEPGGLQSTGSKESDTTELLCFHFNFGGVIGDDEDLDEQVRMKGMAWNGEAKEGTCPSFFLRKYSDRQIHNHTMWVHTDPFPHHLNDAVASGDTRTGPVPFPGRSISWSHHL